MYALIKKNICFSKHNSVVIDALSIKRPKNNSITPELYFGQKFGYSKELAFFPVV